MADIVRVEKFTLLDLEKEITCAVCQEHYTEPKVLPCLHYYCKKCILQLASKTGKDKPFPCPLCRKETKLPEGGVDELKSAFFINSLKSHFSVLELTQGKVEAKCEACGAGGTAVSFCRQCAVFICRACMEAHQMMKMMFEGHEVVSIQDLKEGKAKADVTLKKRSPAKCHTHEELLKVYCFDCNLLICRDCTVKDHRDHNFEFSGVAAPSTKENLLKKLLPLKKIVVNLSTAVKEVQSTKQKIEVQGNTIANDINVSFNELVQVLEVCKQEMLDEAAGTVQEKVEKLTVQEKNLVLAIAEVQSVVDYTERCVNYCTDNEVMSMNADVANIIDHETEETGRSSLTRTVSEEADMGMEVMHTEELQQMCKNKAKITKLTIDPTKCTVIGEGTKTAQVYKAVEIVLSVRLSNNDLTSRKTLVAGELKSMYNGLVLQCEVDQLGQGEYNIRYMPTLRGRHELTVLVDGQHVAGSPFPVFVSIHPTQLGTPTNVWNGLSKPSGISVHQSGEVIVAKQEGDAAVFYKQGKRVQLLTRDQLKLTDYTFTSIPVDKDDYIYLITYMSNKIVKLKRDGTFVKQLLTKASGHLFIAVVGEEVMVSECGNKGTIIVYDRELNYVRKITGSNMGDLRGLAADSAGNIYATDCDKLLVHVFNPHGDHLRSFGKEVLKKPLGLCVAGQFVYVCNNLDHSVCVFTTEGELVTKFGQYGARSGEFNTPQAVCADEDGFVYVCDTKNHRVQVF